MLTITLKVKFLALNVVEAPMVTLKMISKIASASVSIDSGEPQTTNVYVRLASMNLLFQQLKGEFLQIYKIANQLFLNNAYLGHILAQTNSNVLVTAFAKIQVFAMVKVQPKAFIMRLQRNAYAETLETHRMIFVILIAGISHLRHT